MGIRVFSRIGLLGSVCLEKDVRREVGRGDLDCLVLGGLGFVFRY